MEQRVARLLLVSGMVMMQGGGGGGGQGPCEHDIIMYIVHKDIEDICGKSRLVTAL